MWIVDKSGYIRYTKIPANQGIVKIYIHEYDTKESIVYIALASGDEIEMDSFDTLELAKKAVESEDYLHTDKDN